MMSLSQKLESVSMNLPSPQCYVIDVIALPIDTDHFLKFIPECSIRNWVLVLYEDDIKQSLKIIKLFFLIDRGKIGYNFNYCSTRYFVSHASNAPLPFKSTLSRFPALDIVRIRTRWARRQRLRWKSLATENLQLELLIVNSKMKFEAKQVFWVGTSVQVGTFHLQVNFSVSVDAGLIWFWYIQYQALGIDLTSIWKEVGHLMHAKQSNESNSNWNHIRFYRDR